MALCIYLVSGDFYNNMYSSFSPVCALRASGNVWMSLVLANVKFMEMDTTRLLILNGFALMDTVSTHW